MARTDQIERPTEGIRNVRLAGGGPWGAPVPVAPSSEGGIVHSDPVPEPAEAASPIRTGPAEETVTHMD